MRVFTKSIAWSLAVFVLFTFSACSRVESQSTGGSGKAPDFTLKTVSGSSVKLADKLAEGKAVIVFFASWCPPCSKEVPHVNKFYSRHKEDVAVMGINIQESEDKVKAFIKRRDVQYPVVMDRDGHVADIYGVRGIPTVVAIDADGTVLYKGHDIIDMERKVQF